MSEVLSLRRQAEVHDEWLRERLDTVLPRIMERVGIDCWVLITREYNEDPIVRTMLPATWITARRRTILVFTDFGRERVAIARYDVGTAFPGVWDPDQDPNQWRRLGSYLVDKAPQRIAINTSDDFGHADGLTATDHEALLDVLPESMQSRIVGSDGLAVGWLETRSAAERSAYPDVCARAHDILRRGLSAGVVVPNDTTTADLEWWLRQEVARLGYRTWFQPAASVQRRSGAGRGDFASHPADDVIRRGDLLHVDFGIEYLGLHTDQQQHAYVLREGETEAPLGLQRGLEACNKLQDMVMGLFATGITGNDLLRLSLDAGRTGGLDPTIYSHPIGLHGHGAGPTIGLWDQQGGVPGAGDYPVWPNTAYSIELSILVDVPEWDDQQVRIMLEEDAFFDGDEITFLDGRQRELWLI